MINFFRKIRKQMADDNKPLKYMRYAIGEIVLVVVGILIALSINNWNEERKLKIEETKMLLNFKSSIERDNLEIQFHIERFNTSNESIHILMDHLESELPYHDSLSIHFSSTTQSWTPRIDQEVFASLSSADLNIISNDSLKKEIISYYSFAKRKFEVTIGRYTNIIEDASQDIFNSRFNALWNNTWNNPKAIRTQNWMIPNDYEALKKDKEYKYFLGSLKNQLYWLVRDPLDEAKFRAKNLNNSIDKELQELQK